MSLLPVLQSKEKIDDSSLLMFRITFLGSGLGSGELRRGVFPHTRIRQMASQVPNERGPHIPVILKTVLLHLNAMDCITPAAEDFGLGELRKLFYFSGP
mgnify:CR=1 FL=1